MINPMAMMQIMQMANNPQQIVSTIMSNSQMMQNPMAMNLVNMLQNNDKEGIKQLACNICASNGTTPEQVINNIMQQNTRKY